MTQNFFTLFGKVVATISLKFVILVSLVSTNFPESIKQVIDKAMPLISLRIISAYKNYIDLYKKGKCAYRTLHGGLFCSDFIKSVAMENGASAAIPLVQQRYDQCREAYLFLHQDLSLSVNGEHIDCIHCSETGN
ncbi:membrane protein insertion efficiency factor YidD [[Phormidium] sp. ETS-05]|uniref:membrane protein insertion efficiency factor YidD n=1 Tax=[Phormidium] sp. ETS-05 TaxID=222819 RepID=UPI0018EF1240|nr:membrane protein insertion efficiency factor YidD [[Phormidium] sp. ETS-05]